MNDTSRVLQLAAERAIRYNSEIRDRKVAPAAESMDALARLREEFPAAPMDPQKVIEVLDELASPATVAMTGGRYFGFVIGGVLPAALAKSFEYGWPRQESRDAYSDRF